MTVICPACDARFRDPPNDIPKTRPLQCGRCEHEWQLDDDSLNSNEIHQVDAPSIAPDMSDLVAGGSGDEIRTGLPVIMPQVEPAEKPRQPIYVDREVIEDAAPKRRFGLPILGIACLCIIAGSISFKDIVLKHVPHSMAIYQMAGLISSQPELKIANISTTRTKNDGIRRLIVKGEVKNIADSTVPIPPIKLTMRGDANNTLYAWTVSTTKQSLKAGEISQFTAIANDYPGNAVDVEVEFAQPTSNKKASTKIR